MYNILNSSAFFFRASLSAYSGSKVVSFWESIVSALI
jgi:hypothetical protein